MPQSNSTEIKPRDFASDQDVRWCPGCGDCSSRFPYYMNTYGIHSIHGRAPAIATGVKVANPDLDVWVVTGDGDGLSIGGNHLMHILRRNLNIKILLFNNRIYGLTKGQYSPTSEEGKKTKSSPMGVIDLPITPLSFALACEASFVARMTDVDRALPEVLEAAARHKGSAFVEIYQDCNIFNHKAFEFATDKNTREESVIYLEHGKPLIYGKDRDKGIRMTGDGKLEKVTLSGGIKEDDLLFHDEADEKLAFTLSRMTYPDFPEPMGVFYKIEDDCYEDLLTAQVEQAKTARGEGDLEALFNLGDVYEVAG